MSRSQPVFGPLLVWSALLGAALVFAAPGFSKQDPFLRVEGGGVPTVTLRNGSGDGTAVVHVDPSGFFGTSTGGLDFDPVGSLGQAETTFYSGLWFSGSNRAGQDGGTFFAMNGDLGATFTTVTQSRAVSRFTFDGVEFTVAQELLPPSETGSTLRQTYTMKNVGFPGTTTQSSVVDFDLLRHFDGDLTFDQSIDDVAVRAPGGQQLYELDSNDDPEMPTTFVGIDLNGQANLGNRIAEFSFTSQIFQQGRGVLDGSITRDGTGQNDTDADQDNDGVTDDPYDVTLTLGRTFQIPFGETATLVTNTVMGNGAPNDILAAPSDLTVSRQGDDKALLQWQDNSQNERGFEIQRRVDDGEFARRGATDANVNRFTDKKLKANTVYTYRVRALRSAGPTEFSNEAVLDTSGGGSEGQSPKFVDPTPKNGVRLRVDPGQSLQFTVCAEDPDSSLVTLSANGIPKGATVIPTLPATDNPVKATFAWTPSKKDEGIYDVVFSAQSDDTQTESSLSVTRQIRILVGKVGVCVEGEVGENRALRVDGEVGYPRGGRKFHQKLTMKLKAGNKTFKATDISRFELIGGTVRMEGVGTINGRGSFPFALQAIDNGPAPRDRILTVIVDGIPWPTGAMRRGDGVQQHL